MESLKELYRIGNGPSSSHTMGPKKAAEEFIKKNYNADRFVVNLYGSLAATGKGHLTDKVILDTLGKDKTTVNFYDKIFKPNHNNSLEFNAYLNGVLIDSWLVFSVGGGTIKDISTISEESIDLVYEEKSMKEVLSYCKTKNIDFYQYVLEKEPSIEKHLEECLDMMFDCVERGLATTTVLPGALKIKRRANDAYSKYLLNKNFDALVFASALAASEENASGNIVVTAPTCGSCGVVAGLLYALYLERRFTKKEMIKGLAVGGVIGNLVKQNASISGAEVGCQGEVGTACSMASAIYSYLMGGSLEQIEYASEIALEHNLGMTCDPILGYVQIPCIERNALACRTAIACAEYALLTNGEHYISLDSVIDSMKQTGIDLKRDYKETSLGGLAKINIETNVD